MSEIIIADQTWNREQRNREADRLTQLTKRDVDFRATSCDCDEWKYCGKCGGSGSYHEAYFLSCDHPVYDGDDPECIENFCRERERASAEFDSKDSFPVVHKGLISCREMGEETEVA